MHFKLHHLGAFILRSDCHFEKMVSVRKGGERNYQHIVLNSCRIDFKGFVDAVAGTKTVTDFNGKISDQTIGEVQREYARGNVEFDRTV